MFQLHVRDITDAPGHRATIYSIEFTLEGQGTKEYLRAETHVFKNRAGYHITDVKPTLVFVTANSKVKSSMAMIDRDLAVPGTIGSMIGRCQFPGTARTPTHSDVVRDTTTAVVHWIRKGMLRGVK